MVSEKQIEAAADQISEGLGAFLRKFCDSEASKRARYYLHEMPKAEWNQMALMLATEALTAAEQAETATDAEPVACVERGSDQSTPQPESRLREEGAARIAALEAENERLRKDAERYRALRDGSLDDLAVVRGLGVTDYGLNVVLYTYSKEIEGDEMDNAIDAACRAHKEASDERS